MLPQLGLILLFLEYPWMEITLREMIKCTMQLACAECHSTWDGRELALYAKAYEIGLLMKANAKEGLKDNASC